MKTKQEKRKELKEKEVLQRSTKLSTTNSTNSDIRAQVQDWQYKYHCNLCYGDNSCEKGGINNFHFNYYYATFPMQANTIIKIWDRDE